MDIAQMGVIIKARRKAECVDFYRGVIGLEVLFEDDFLTCFACGAGYLMIEPLESDADGAPSEHLVVRIHVEDVPAQRDRLVAFGVEVHHHVFDWGEILVLEDPAGTRIELKDQRGFRRQMREYRERTRTES